MSVYISANLRQQVIARAKHRCEYCGLAQAGQEATFHIDHIIPIKGGGSTTIDNLALACVSCSLRKAAKETALDPQTEETVSIFNPRKQTWSDHFLWSDVRLVGVTAVGRATIAALKLNRPIILAIREEEQFLGRHPKR